MSLAELPVVADRPAAHDALVDVAGLRAALAQAIAGEVRFERLDRALYSTDASVYQIVPVGVVIPKTRDDVLATVRTCARFGVPLTARGGGTSQAGQSIGPGVILDFSKYLSRILEVNEAERWARVEPGCVLDDLNQEVKRFGLHFAPDISTANRATIGGMIANNSSGTHSIVYGKTVDHVLELTVLLADGSVVLMRPLNEAELEAKCRQQDLEGDCYRVIRRLAAEHAGEIDRRFPKILRRVGGYNLDLFIGRSRIRENSGSHPDPHSHECGYGGFNLAQLFVGSEGTLGIVLEAKLRLVELPKAKALLVVQFAELLEALAATPGILAHAPAAVEVMDRYILDCTKLNADALRLRGFLHGDAGTILIIEFYGSSLAELPPRLQALEKDLSERGFGFHYSRVTEPTAQAAIWKLRTLALGLSMAEKGDAKAISFVEDSAVAPEHLRDYIAEFLKVVARHGTKAGVYAHASVGCLHVRPVIDLKTAEGVRRFQAIADDVADLVLKYGGALSGEHGDGLVRSPFQEKMYGPAIYEAFRQIKRAFDPSNLLNPGKIVDAPPVASNLRYGPAYVTPEVPTTFDFSTDGGLARSAELCAGVGECRKKRGGVMCPSYQATLEEQHSTRGRANALRLALTGQLDLGGLTDPAVLAALDLCLECKACKSECPTNVDMARLKAEVLHQHFQKRGLPWRNWLFGNVAALGKWGCRLAPVSNWWARAWLGRWLNEKLFGIDRRRRPPTYATSKQRRALADFLFSQDDGIGERPARSVVFFPDTFVRFYEPALGLAACQLLEMLGYGVHMEVHLDCWDDWIPTPPLEDFYPKLRCCGRPFISNGLLDAAVDCAKSNVEWLYPLADRGDPIIACEPSCILTIKDDYPALLKGEERRQAQVVADKCFTFDEFLEKSLVEKDVNLFRPGPKRILVQGHCHQRSLVGMTPTLRLLRRIPGAEVIDLDAGCCGMAGSFGYEKEHYEISCLVGEQRLFPALRQNVHPSPSGKGHSIEGDNVIVAPGFSCRLQIEHFTGLKAFHPASLLRSLML
ncbi:MAG: FAD-binding protein [Gemmataceae bacterium]|nr:FAD-binding protein [Gemmataceae bacterium]MCI0743236.1 FAD-binding protein [Gemmataceae bacterium]